MDNFKFNAYEYYHEIEKFDMTITAAEQEGKIKIVLGYAKSLFNEKFINEFKEHFENISQLTSEECDINIEDIRLVSKQDITNYISVINEQAYGEIENEFDF